MTNVQMWAIIVGFFSPLVVALIQQPTWSLKLRAVVGFLAAAVFGTGTAYFAGDFNGASLVSGILLVLVSAIASYKGLWQPTGVAPRIETATSPSTRVGETPGKRAIR
jgi:hypothetical protein